MYKKTIIVILSVLVLGILGFTGYKTVDYINQKNAEKQEIREIQIEIYYENQNKAFYDMSLQERYAPYKKKYEWLMQARINYYTQKTGKTMTLSDIETFLSVKENPDGTPRTWMDDETGIIKDYVKWSRSDDNLLLMRQYEGDLRDILADYRAEHLDCPYRILEDLSPEQINELSKKYDDPDYELVLG